MYIAQLMCEKTKGCFDNTMLLQLEFALLSICHMAACVCMQQVGDGDVCGVAVWPNEAKVLDTHQPSYKINRDRTSMEDSDVRR